MLLPEKNEISERVDSCVQRYQAGDQSALDDVYEHLAIFCLRVISKTCGKYVQTDDEEAGIISSVILNGVEKYNPERGAFLGYLGRAVRNRTIDGARQAKRNPSVPVSSLRDEQISSVEKADLAFFANIIDDVARKQDIEILEKLLADFELTFQELGRVCPRQSKTRQQAQRAAHVIAQDSRLTEFLLEKKMLPSKIIEENFQINRNIMDRYRKYIIAVVLIIIHDLEYLKPYVLPTGGDKHGLD